MPEWPLRHAHWTKYQTRWKNKILSDHLTWNAAVSWQHSLNQYNNIVSSYQGPGRHHCSWTLIHGWDYPPHCHIPTHSAHKQFHLQFQFHLLSSLQHTCIDHSNGNSNFLHTTTITSFHGPSIFPVFIKHYAANPKWKRSFSIPLYTVTKG